MPLAIVEKKKNSIECQTAKTEGKNDNNTQIVAENLDGAHCSHWS
jgi:hypothetical protein